MRHTAGSADQFMGELAPNGHDLVFVSTENATSEAFIQDIRRGAAEPLFENDADLTAPRLSPDGTRLLFISYRADALGDTCIYDGGERLRRRDGRTTCLTGPDSADGQAFWFPDGLSVGVVQRRGIHGDYRLLQYPTDGGKPVALLQRNLSSPIMSPSGGTIAYVPIERGSSEVGIQFSVMASGSIELYRLHDHQTFELKVDLPGTSGFPAFSADGRWLYFSQYLNDTNFDGVIDGNDNSVLFRVRFDEDAADPLSTHVPDQLTSALWNCQYPAPGPSRLVMTCAFEGSLDIYSLPLDGSVPSELSAAELREELHVSRNHWEKLLLLLRLLSLTQTPEERIPVLRPMARLHLELREYESADFYVRLLLEAGEDEAFASAAAELVGHRREEQRLAEGQISEQFLAAQRERLRRLSATAAGKGSAAALARLVTSEIHDTIGEKAAALRAFESVDLDTLTDPFVLHVLGDRAPRLLRPLGQRDRLLAVTLALSTKQALDPLDRIVFARRFVEDLLRGTPASDRPALVAEWLGKVDPSSEAALLLELEQWLGTLTPETSEEVRKGVFELYRRTRDVDLRKALVLTTVSRGLGNDDEQLAYEFANSWASWLKRSNAERRYAETLYRNIVLERAYGELAAGDLEDARGVFYGATLQTESFEAHTGFIEARLRSGHDDVGEIYAKRYAGEADGPVQELVAGYLLARRLWGPQRNGDVSGVVDAALDHIRAATLERPHSAALHLLWGALAHERFSELGDAESALEAHTQYLVALDLARDNPRYQASLLLNLGLLQAALGNHRIALRYLDERAKRPVLRPETQLSLTLARARSLLHTERPAEAAADAERALSLVDATPALSRYRPLALDRAALYEQVAGNASRSYELYDQLLPLIDDAEDQDDLGALGNRVKARMGRAAAGIQSGHADVAITDLEQAQALLATDDPFHPAKESASQRIRRPGLSRESYEALVQGLLAAAFRTLGRLPEAREALERRHDLIADRRALPAVLPDLVKVRYDLAEVAYRQGDLDGARSWLEQALSAADRFRAETNTPVTVFGLRALEAYAELHLIARVPLEQLREDLPGRLRETYDLICENRNPDWQHDRVLLQVYLTLLRLDSDELSDKGGAHD